MKNIAMMVPEYQQPPEPPKTSKKKGKGFFGFFGSKKDKKDKRKGAPKINTDEEINSKPQDVFDEHEFQMFDGPGRTTRTNTVMAANSKRFEFE